MSTQYPGRIDDLTSLTLAIDNNTPVSAPTVNDLRGAIIAIEAALGTRPGATHGTVKNRIDAIDLIIAALQLSGGFFLAGGDLSGTSLSQTVIGMQGNPVSIIDPSDGYILAWSTAENEWQPKPILVNLASTSVYGILPLIKQAAPTGTGVVKTVGGFWVSSASTIVNADISSSAAIDYSKLGISAQTLGAQQFSSTVDPKGKLIDVQPKNVQTTNATPTP